MIDLKKERKKILQTELSPSVSKSSMTDFSFKETGLFQIQIPFVQGWVVGPIANPFYLCGAYTEYFKQTDNKKYSLAAIREALKNWLSPKNTQVLKKSAIPAVRRAKQIYCFKIRLAK